MPKNTEHPPPEQKNNQTKWNDIDPRTHRRILRFINAARRPEDLTLPPNQEIQIIEERPGFKGPDLHEPLRRPTRKGFLDLEVAKRVIDWRERNSPLYGYLNIAQILEIEGIRDVLDGIFTSLSAASQGQWDTPVDIPVGFETPIHAALVRTATGVGKVLFFGVPTGINTFLWDPNVGGPAGFNSPTTQPVHSLFCSGHSFLSDGTLLVVGGGGDGTATPHHNHAWKFNPQAETWVQTIGNGTPGNGDMQFTRWYPTCVTMGDEPGRVLVVNGVNGTVSQMEMYFESSDRFEPVWGPGGAGDTSANRAFSQLYPGLSLLPGGEVFYTPTGWSSSAALPSAYFSFSSTSPPVTGSWTDVGPLGPLAVNRARGMAVLLMQTTFPFVQVMVVGGGDATIASTYQLINLSELSPTWGSSLSLPDSLARVNVNLVLLPDGRVFVCGGRPLEGTPPNGGSCWIYDPSSYTWTEMDALTNARQYHSVALLLPSGKVMAAGADSVIEVFSPPYLFNPDGTLAARPTITSAPALVHHGNSFAIETTEAPDITKVVFVRPMAVTHQTDSEQRVIPLSFTPTGPTTLTATAPNGWHPHATAPRGYYMLFILNGDGVPSEAKFIQLH